MWRLHRTSPSFIRRLSASAAMAVKPIPPEPVEPFAVSLERLAAPLEPPSVPVEPLAAPLDYLEGFPRPDPRYAETILAVPRGNSGKSIAAKERQAGRVPSIVFEQEKGEEGGNKRLISVKRSQIWKLVKNLGSPFFLSRLFDLEVRSDFEGSGELIEKIRVLPRLLHLHPTTDVVLNVTFLRAPSSALLKVNVPLVYVGEDSCPGLRKGGYLQALRRTVRYLCPADVVPPYIQVDLSELNVNQKLYMRDLKVHPDMKLLKHSPDEPICKIKGSRVSENRKPK